LRWTLRRNQWGDIIWYELEEYLKFIFRINKYNKNTEKIVYMCETDWRTSLAAMFTEELNLADTISALDSDWFEWSEEFLEH
ncbi:unnamed protein product, partial [Rotaria magnacalcarata]